MYATLFGLLAATGLRISEALAMRLEDVTEDGLIIRQTKFHKSRLVPVHPTTQQALNIYRNVRGANSVRCSLFVSLWGKRLAYVTVDAIFLRLARSIGLRGEPGQRGARMHDLRHTFAVRSLEQCGHDDNTGRAAPCSPQYLSRSCACHEHLLVPAGYAQSYGANSECR